MNDYSPLASIVFITIHFPESMTETKEAVCNIPDHETWFSPQVPIRPSAECLADKTMCDDFGLAVGHRSFFQGIVSVRLSVATRSIRLLGLCMPFL
jgi:hypothetical protein